MIQEKIQLSLYFRTQNFKGFPQFNKCVFPENAHNSLVKQDCPFNFLRFTRFFQLSNSNKSVGRVFSREVRGIGNNTCMKPMVVRIVKAGQLGQVSPASKPYVVLEIDEPSQRYQTKTTRGPSWVWDEQFSV